MQLCKAIKCIYFDRIGPVCGKTFRIILDPSPLSSKVCGWRDQPLKLTSGFARMFLDMRRKIVVICILLCGCATAYKMNSIRVGMTRAEVVQVMGTPASTSSKGNTEYLNYRLSETDDQAFYGVTKPYYVRLIDGRVDSFGKLGDFDSTQKPTVRIESDANIKTDNTTSSKSTLYDELIKLKHLKDEGVITAAEYNKEKQELLNRY